MLRIGNLKVFNAVRYVLLMNLIISIVGCANVPKEREKEITAEQAAAQAQQSMIRGDNALRDGKSDKALYEYVSVLRWDPKNIEAYYKIGHVHEINHNLEPAEVSYLKVLELDANHAGALEGLGLVLLRQGKREAAKQKLERAIVLNSNSWRAHNGLGVIYDLNNDFSLAQYHYLAALRAQPRSVMLLNNLGYSRYLAGYWDSALAYFNQTLTIDPMNRRTWSNLGLLYVRMGNYTDATNAFGKVMDEPQALNNVGYLCMLEGKYNIAERFFRKAIRTSPSYYAVAYENLSLLKTSRNKTFENNKR
jgi:Flp pilus assembly protein TadD